MEGHEERVKQVLYRLKQNGLQIKIKKCELIKPSIRFLGHLISNSKVEKSQHLLKAIAKAELPKTMRQLQGFMVLANYNLKFIKGFAKIAAPLNKHYKIIHIIHIKMYYCLRMHVKHLKD